MTSADEQQFFLPAWGISLTLHGAVVGLALAFTIQVKPILQEDVFKWNVALVEAVKSESLPEQVQSVVTPEQPPSRATLPTRPKRVPETYQAVKPLERKVEPSPPAIEPVQPVEQKVEPPQPREEPIEQRTVEVAEPKPEPVAVAASTEPVEAPSAQPTTDVSVAAAPYEASAPQEAQLPSHESSMDNAPVQTAKAAALGSEVKLDNRWLAESLWRRVAELKRYPSSARLNGQEGKVILKATIRSDGHLADVSIQKSSGHSVLDLAAMEAVKLACPLHMKHAIGKPLIVVSLPIVYSLAN